MKMNYDDINSRDSPYQLFLDSIKSPETVRKYKKMLERFLLSIPDKDSKKYREVIKSIKEGIKKITIQQMVFLDLKLIVENSGMNVEVSQKAHGLHIQF